MEKLIIEGDEGGPLEFELDGDVVTLGRHEENRITIENRYLSQFHAKFSRVAGKEGREILDLDSYNGTKVNGQRIVREILKPGDTIQFGLLTARYETNGAKSAAPSKSESSASTANGAREGETRNGKSGSTSRDAQPEVGVAQQSQLKLAIERARTHVDTAKHELPSLNANGAVKGENRKGGRTDHEVERSRAELARLREQMSSERTEMARLKKTSSAMRDELVTTEKALADARSEMQGASKELTEARNSLANLQALTEAERSGLTSIGEQIKSLREEGDKVKSADKSLAAKLDEIAEAKLELEHLQAAISRAKKEIETTKQSLSSTNEELQKAMADHHAIVVRSAEARGDLEILESEIRQKANEIARIKADQEHLQSLLDDEIRRFEEHTTEQTTINLELEQSTRKLTRVKYEIGEAENRLDTLTHETAEKERIARSKLSELEDELLRKTQQVEKQEADQELQRRLEEEIERVNQAAAAAPPQSDGQPDASAADQATSDAAAAEPAPATPKSSISLAEELIKIGFNLEPIKRKTDGS